MGQGDPRVRDSGDRDVRLAQDLRIVSGALLDIAYVLGMSGAVPNSGAAERTDAEPPLTIARGGVRIADALEQWDADMIRRDLAPAYRRKAVSAIRQASEQEGWVWVSQITTDAVRLWLARRKAAGAGPKWLNALRDFARLFVGFAGCAEGPNPVDAVRSSRVPRRRSRVVPTTAQVQSLIEVAGADWRKTDRWLVYLVASTTGLRMGTLAAARRAWYHHDARNGLAWIDVPAAEIKGKRDERVWLTRECAEHLDRHKAPGGRLFIAVPRPKHFERDRAAAGLAKADGMGATLTRHSLRHFAISRLRWADTFSLRERAAQATHRTTSITEGIYTDPAAMDLGRKIYGMQPMLPPGFAPARRGQEAKTC